VRHRRTVALLLAATAALTAACDDAPGDDAALEVGTPAPDFRLETLDRERFYLHQHRGKLVALVFWESWCTVCKEALIALSSAGQALGRDQVVAVAVLGDPENRAAAQDALKGLPVDLPVLLDPGKRVGARFDVRAVPTTALLDRDGRLGLKRQGWDAGVARQVREWLRERVPRRGTP